MLAHLFHRLFHGLSDRSEVIGVPAGLSTFVVGMANHVEPVAWVGLGISGCMAITALSREVRAWLDVATPERGPSPMRSANSEPLPVRPARLGRYGGEVYGIAYGVHDHPRVLVLVDGEGDVAVVMPAAEFDRLKAAAGEAREGPSRPPGAPAGPRPAAVAFGGLWPHQGPPATRG